MDEHLSPEEQELSREREETAKLTAIQLRDDIRVVMASEAGRRICWSLLTGAGVFRTSFSTDAVQMAFNEGRRNEGLKLLTLLQLHCPHDYLRMQAEHQPKGSDT